MKKKIQICLIGTGRAGMIHARNMRNFVTDADIAAVCDVDAAGAEKAASELGADRVYTDYREALEDCGTDAVIVATPTKYHCEIIVGAAACKKHMLCEKPMAMTVEECEKMTSAAEQAGVNLQLGFMRRFDADFRRAKEIIDAGEIGEITCIKSKTRGPSIPRPWMYDIGKSNGPLAEVNSHDIDTVRWLTGSEAESVCAIAGNFRCGDARENWPDFYDTVFMNIRMKNGILCNIDGAQGVRYGYDAGVEILGTHGRITVGEIKSGSVMTCEKNGRVWTDAVSSWRELYREAYIEEDRSFVSSIINGVKPVVGGEDGKRAVEIVKAGNRSIKTGEIVKLEVAG